MNASYVMLFVKKLEKCTHTNMTNLLDISFILKKQKWNVQDYFRPDYILYGSFMARLFKKKKICQIQATLKTLHNLIYF